MIDSEGFRPNVGIILCNTEGRLFWAKRIGQHSWQFPQGGIQRDESPEQAMFRELAEEVGLRPDHVQVIGSTRGWLRYRLPKRLVRHGVGDRPICIGQKQVWFLLRMRCGEDAVRLDSSERPEFDLWQWVDYWYPLRAVVPFKRHVYWRALHELAPLVFSARRVVAPEEDIVFRRPAEYAPGPRREPAAIRPSRRSLPIRTPESVAPISAIQQTSVAIKQITILPLRSVETGRNPVITRRVVSVRRLALDATTAVLPPVALASLDELRSIPAAPGSHCVSRR